MVCRLIRWYLTWICTDVLLVLVLGALDVRGRLCPNILYYTRIVRDGGVLLTTKCCRLVDVRYQTSCYQRTQLRDRCD
jgi:hypothetical protein